MQSCALLLSLMLVGSPTEEPGPAADTLLLDLEQIDRMTLADVLAAPVTVATGAEETVRSSPGVLTVVTREEMLAWGARDLLEVLELVPGFGFGIDVQGALGAGFRGMWGHEGKVLLLVDGHELNEGLYLTNQFGHHYPVDDLERVEIIRGPGSVIYGGYAELAVVNVVTRGGAAAEHFSASGRWDAPQGADYSRRSLGLSAGTVVTRLDGLYLSASAHLGDGRRAVGTYQDFQGDSFTTRDASSLRTAGLNANLRWRGLRVGLLLDSYRVEDRTAFGENLPAATRNDFGSIHARARYEAQLGHGVTLTPMLHYQRQTPWQVLSAEPATAELLFYDKTFQRVGGGLRLAWDILDGLNLLAGVEGRYDHASIGQRGPGGTDEHTGLNQPFDGADSVGYQNLAAYLQLLWSNPVVNVSAGARAEQHSAYGFSFVPRLGLTKVVGDLHVKALYSQAFKVPGIENIRINPELKPERGHMLELEVGYLFRDTVFLSLNGFDCTLSGPIVYATDEAGTETYLNYQQSGTRGVEAELKLRHQHGFAAASWSFYTSDGKNQVPVYAVPQTPDALLGLAAHKLTFAGAVELAPGVRVGTSLVLLGPRWAVTGVDVAGDSVYGQLDWQAVWNLGVFLRMPFAPSLTVALEAHNLADQKVWYPQPYDGGHAALPGMGRELGLRLSWEQ